VLVLVGSVVASLLMATLAALTVAYGTIALSAYKAARSIPLPRPQPSRTNVKRVDPWARPALACPRMRTRSLLPFLTLSAAVCASPLLHAQEAAEDEGPAFLQVCNKGTVAAAVALGTEGAA
jgi:hypothetical protein